MAASPKIGPYPKLEFNPPTPERRVLSNGVVVFLLEDHELPLVDVTLRMPLSPADLPGEPWLTAQSFLATVWRSGGTTHRSPDKLDEELEFLPASVTTGAGEEMATVSFSCLSWDMDTVMDIWSDVLFNPRFDSKRLAVAKGKAMEGWRRRNDAPASIARRLFRDVLYGDDHFYARNQSPETIKRVSRSHLKKLHKKFVSPDGAILSAVGDFESDKFVSALEERFKNWKKSGRRVPSYDYAISDAPEGRIFFVQKESNQSTVYFGGSGLTRHDPDQYAMAVANTIVGGGGYSRLFGEIRSRLGLAYAIGSFFDKPKGPGLVGIGLQTKTESTVQATEAVDRVLSGVVASPPDQQELRHAKDVIINSFVFEYESTEHIADQTARLEFFGYDKDFLKNYPENIRRVTAGDVWRVAKKYFSPDKLKIVVVGDREKFKGPLETAGEIKTVPLGDIE